MIKSTLNAAEHRSVACWVFTSFPLHYGSSLSFSTYCYVLSRCFTFTLFCHDPLRFSFPPCLPWQIFKLSKNLQRRPRLSRPDTFAYPMGGSRGGTTGPDHPWNCQIINFCHVEIFRQTPSGNLDPLRKFSGSAHAIPLPCVAV